MDVKTCSNLKVKKMGFDFEKFGEGRLDEAFVDWLVEEKWPELNNHFGKLWDYYENKCREVNSAGLMGGGVGLAGRGYIQAQEMGLPARITGRVRYLDNDLGRIDPDVQRKEIVIENDIGWRVNAMVDFLFGKGIKITSRAGDEVKRREIDQIINAVFERNGSVGFFQDMAVLGSVYGFVDCLVRPGRAFGMERGEAGLHTKGTSIDTSFSSILDAAGAIDLELVEAPRALPVLCEDNYRKIDFYIQHFYQAKNTVSSERGFLKSVGGFNSPDSERSRVEVTEIIGADYWQRYENGRVSEEGRNPFGFVPVVHVQNLAQPYYYEGLSDVEQLMSLQDELNTRLSDRANRLTYQAFKMFLAKGIEGFLDKPVAPGTMWFTHNPDASIEQFGGDSNSPSEDQHIAEIRDAMDKVSGVTPVVAGVLKNKVGHLTSAVAIKMVFMGMLAKTERKQFTYGEGIKDICGLVLELLDRLGIYKSSQEDRKFNVIFPNPLPEDILDKLKEAQIKKDLGVPQDEIMKELGYEI